MHNCFFQKLEEICYNMHKEWIFKSKQAKTNYPFVQFSDYTS